MDRWPGFFAILLAVPLGGHALATDTFDTMGLVNIEDVRGDGYSYTELIFDAQVCLKIFGSSSYLQFAGENRDACTHITGSSWYSLSDVELPDNPTRVQYVLVTNGEQMDVRDSNNDYHKIADPVTELIYSGYRLNHNIVVPSEPSNALWLYHDWMTFTRFVESEFGKTMDLGLTVMYEEGEFPGSNYKGRNRVVTLQGEGLHEPHDNAIDDQWIVLHEFSHHLMNEAYDDHFSTYKSYPHACVDENSQTIDHYIHKASNGKCAFSEGFANMMPHLILDETVIEVKTSDYTFDIETPEYMEGNVVMDIAEGVAVEGRVAAAFFDLLDLGNGNDERVTEDKGDFWEVTEVFQLGIAPVVGDFYENWKDRHGYDSRLDSIYELNTLSAVLRSRDVIEVEDPVVSPSGIVLSWDAPATGPPPEFYEILRSSSPFVSIANVTSTTYVDGDVLPSTTYRYQIIPHSNYGPGTPSLAVNATTADTVSLAITAPPDVTVEATGVLSTVSIGTATITGGQDPGTTITNDAPVSGFPVGNTTVTWTVTDTLNMTATDIQTVTIRDTAPPRIAVPADITTEASGVLTMVSIGQATATDIADPDPAVTNDAPESFPLGDTVITWTAIDSSGNAATDIQTVTIQDTTLPSITAPPDVTTEASGVLTVTSIGQATAIDTADPDPAITNDAPESFPLGDTVITWTATDSSGNAATATQTVTIQDTTPPSITAPANHTAEAAGIMTILNVGDYGTPTVSDIADPSPTITNDAPESFPLGNTTVTWTAADSSGNEATAAQTVTIQDTTPPAISGLRNISVDDPAGRGMEVSYDAPTAADLVDGVVAVSCTHESGSTFAPGFTEVSCTATDGSANSQRDWFIIHVDASDAILDVFQTVSTGRSTWSVTGPDRVFAGQTFEYTVTLEDGARPRLESLAVYSTAPERDLGWYDPDTDCQTVICAGFPEQKHDTYKIASDEDSPYTAMHNKMKKSRSSHTILLQPAADAPAGTQATVGMMDGNNNQVGGIPVTVLPPSAKTITGERATWRITGPDRIFPGQTFEYTVTLDGTRHQHDALAIYSSSLTVDDFGGLADDSACGTTVCTDFPGQRRRTMELDNHAGSVYDVRYHTINAPGSQYTILLRTADDAEAGGTFRVGLVDGDGSPMGSIRVTIADPVAVTAPYEELVAGLSFEGSLADITGDNNGTAAGDVTYVPGRIGRGLQLDGSTNVTLAGEADFDFGRTDPFSIAFWLRQDVPVNNSTMIMSKVESFGHTGSYVWIWGGAPNRILLSIHDNSTFINVHTPNHLNMSDGAWHHIAFTYDGSGVKEGLNAYIDGEHRDYDGYRRGLGLEGNTTNDHAFTVRTTSWGDPDRIDSVLDELRVYGAELSAWQMRLLHAAGLD